MAAGSLSRSQVVNHGVPSARASRGRGRSIICLPWFCAGASWLQLIQPTCHEQRCHSSGAVDRMGLLSFRRLRSCHVCCAVGAGILFTISVLWYWGSKRKVMALDSQKVLLADLFRVKHPADEDDRHAAALPVFRQLCSCGKISEGTLKACWWCNGTGQMLACYLHALMLIIDVVQHLSPVEGNHSKERGPDNL